MRNQNKNDRKTKYNFAPHRKKGRKIKYDLDTPCPTCEGELSIKAFEQAPIISCNKCGFVDVPEDKYVSPRVQKLVKLLSRRYRETQRERIFTTRPEDRKIPDGPV